MAAVRFSMAMIAARFTPNGPMLAGALTAARTRRFSENIRAWWNCWSVGGRMDESNFVFLTGA